MAPKWAVLAATVGAVGLVGFGGLHSSLQRVPVTVDGATAGSWYNVRASGATGNGVTSDSAAIQAAIDAAERHGGGTVFFPCGTYLLQSSDRRITVTHSNIRLIGRGGCSVLKLAGPTSFVGISASSPGGGQLTPFARTPPQNSPTVTVTNAQGFRVGQYVLLQDPQNREPAAGGSAAELDQVLAVSGPTLTLATPVSYTFTAAHAGAGIRPFALLTGVTIRDLTINGSGMTSRDGNTVGIRTWGTVGAIIADIRGEDVSGSVVQQDYAYQRIVRNVLTVGSGSGGLGAFEAAVATACAYSNLVSVNAGLESLAQGQARPEGFGLVFSVVSASTAYNLPSQGSYHGRGMK